jgi:hypothetical protein
MCNLGVSCDHRLGKCWRTSNNSCPAGLEKRLKILPAKVRRVSRSLNLRAFKKEGMKFVR